VKADLILPLKMCEFYKPKHADQFTKERATPYRIHVSPMLIRHSWEQLVLNKRIYMQ